MWDCGLKIITGLSMCMLLYVHAAAQDISFCGEPVPVNNDFVAQKLMNVISRQIPYVNLASLRQNASKYFPVIETFLKKNGIPDDFKYIPIVESGFVNLSSGAGANGFAMDARCFRRLAGTTDAEIDLGRHRDLRKPDAALRQAIPIACNDRRGWSRHHLGNGETGSRWRGRPIRGPERQLVQRRSDAGRARRVLEGRRLKLSRAASASCRRRSRRTCRPPRC